jgi:ATP-dependent DNA helicase RecG
MNLSTPIEYVKGVGPQRGEKLQSELGVLTCEDLLNLFPFRYNDRSQFHKVNQLHPDMPNVQIIGKLRHIQEFGKPRQRRLSAKLVDETGTVELVWFKGVQWVKKGLKEGVDYVLFGKPSTFKGKINFAHPELEPLSKANAKNKPGLEPVYSTTEKLTGVGLHSKGLAKLIKTVLDSGEIKFEETMSKELMEHYKLIDKTKAYHIVHQPPDSRSLQMARYRLKFEELFFVQMQILRSKLNRQEKYKGFVFERVGENFNNFYQNHLPFELTGAQKRVMKELRRDLGTGEQMNRLLPNEQVTPG